MTDAAARLRRGYSLGSVATGAFGTVPGLLLLPYLTDTLGIAAVLAGVIVFAPKAWDVIVNPIVGRMSDRYAATHQTRRPFLLVGGLGLAVTFALLFAGPESPQWLAAVWVVVLFLLAATAYAFFQVPFVAMPAELTDDYTERTRIMTWRVAVLSVAILVSGGSAPAIRDAVGGKDGYRAMGVAVALLLAVGTVGSYVGTRRAPATRVRAVTGTLRDQLRIVSAVPDFRRLLATYMLQALAIGAILAGVDYLSRDVLGNKSLSSVLFACFVAPALLVAPLWQRFAARHGKTTGYRAATLVLLAATLALTSARVAPHIVVFLATAVAGVGYAGTQVFPLAMLPDVASVDAVRSGHNRIGVFTGVWTAGETLGLAVGPGAYALVLAAGGYVSSTGGHHPVQPGGALTAITLGISLLPAVLVAASLLPLRRYRLTSADVAAAAAVGPDMRTDSGRQTDPSREDELDGR